MEVLDVPRCLLEIVFSGKTSVRVVDVAAALQWDHMNVFTERTLVWVLAGRARFIFLLLSHLFPPLCLHISPPIRALWQCGAHGAQRTARTWRCLGGVTRDARSETTSSGERTLWSSSGHIIKLLHLWGKSIFGKLLKTFFWVFFLLLILFQMIVGPLRRSVGRSDFSSPRVTVTGRNGNALNT